MQNSKENTCAKVFFNKVAGITLATLLKKGLWHSCFPVNFAKFLRALFQGTPLVAASVIPTLRFVLVIIKGMSTVDQSIETNSVGNLFKTCFFPFLIKIYWECVILNQGDWRLFLPTTSLLKLKILMCQIFCFEIVCTMLKDFLKCFKILFFFFKTTVICTVVYLLCLFIN